MVFATNVGDVGLQKGFDLRETRAESIERDFFWGALLNSSAEAVRTLVAGVEQMPFH